MVVNMVNSSNNTENKTDNKEVTVLYSSIYKTYINHTDAGGIVYHGNYLTFYENCRRDWFTEIGFDGYFLDSETINGHHVVYHPVVTDARVRYFKPILLDMKILVTIDEVKIKPASLIFTQSIYNADRANEQLSEKLSTSTMTIACVSHSSEPKTAVDKIDDKINGANTKDNNTTLKVARLPMKLVEAMRGWEVGEV